MFETQKGQIDWHKLHIGEIQDFCFAKNQHAFWINTTGLFGYLDLTTGTIEWRKDLGESRQLTLLCADKYAMTIKDNYEATTWNDKGQLMVLGRTGQGQTEGDAHIYMGESKLMTVISDGKNIQVHEGGKLLFNMNLNQATETVRKLHSQKGSLYVIKETVTNEIVIDKAIIATDKSGMKLTKVYESKAFKSIESFIATSDYLVIKAGPNNAGVSKATVFSFED